MSIEEAARYDRQIRLWGKSAQMRLMKTSLSFHGILGVSSEIVLNVVLSGVHSVFINDPCAPSLHDLRTNFLLQNSTAEDAVTATGARSDTRIIPVLRHLNPFVNVVQGTADDMKKQALLSSLIIVHITTVNTLSEMSDVVQKSQCAEILVFLHEIDDAFVAFFLYKKTGKDFVDQEQNLLDPYSMHLRPASVQKAIFSLVLGDIVQQNPEATFMDRILFLTRAAEKLKANSLTSTDIESLCNQQERKPLDSSSCTACGAAVAQHLLRSIMMDISSSSFKWLIFDPNSGSINFGN